MSHLYSHLNTAKNILGLYTGQIPFDIFLRQFFAAEKKYGSKDRKSISALCYNYFRLGTGCTANTEDQLLGGAFLCNNEPQLILQLMKPDWNDRITLPLAEKLALVPFVDPARIFPFIGELSKDIQEDAFSLSFLIQPKLFIRTRPGKSSIVKQKLQVADIPFSVIATDCLALKNGTKLDTILELNKEYVVQDFNSQRVGTLLPKFDNGVPGIWDCCAASGGKTILAYDTFKRVDMTVSDIRPGILHNLENRLLQAGIRGYKSIIVDLSNEKALSTIGNRQFDLVICDAPCSGSGTWGRTPEQLTFFRKEEIERYSTLQRTIAINVSRFVRPGGFLLYSTCSVFTRENEDVVKLITGQQPFTIIQSSLLTGYHMQADTLFATLLQRTASD
ncbi:Fmu (Sun) domain-containing protein [Segetibacter sp. 3557_3]|uniref:Fmu (Sun) domain-containing protein n=1 Tax=Segetibacter sp. 3557_3 TaxID=2547429 RepID=UPI001058CC04|nr:Fmu (Sun) domain-containing protein [Segetibacter sp. 3557_3]TDH26452.1 Fmu (Sun) domain-containing protein [Segetibacter sp. 3557_3]